MIRTHGSAPHASGGEAGPPLSGCSAATLGGLCPPRLQTHSRSGRAWACVGTASGLTADPTLSRARCSAWLTRHPCPEDTPERTAEPRAGKGLEAPGKEASAVQGEGMCPWRVGHWGRGEEGHPEQKLGVHYPPQPFNGRRASVHNKVTDSLVAP